MSVEIASETRSADRDQLDLLNGLDFRRFSGILKMFIFLTSSHLGQSFFE